MFDHHRKSPWFAEKYDPAPELVYLRKRLRKEGWKGRMHNFVLSLDAGQYDPDLREPSPEPTSPVKEDASGPQADVEMKVEPKTEPVESEPMKDEPDDNGGMAPGDESMKVEDDAAMDGDEDGDKPDVNGRGSDDLKRKDRSEEISVLGEGNQVMIRTIPPDIGRIKLETVGVREVLVALHLVC
jgi:hypothetical protein